MLGEITEKLSQVTRLFSTTLEHFGDFLMQDLPIDYSSKRFANEKYRIQHVIGKNGVNQPSNH